MLNLLEPALASLARFLTGHFLFLDIWTRLEMFSRVVVRQEERGNRSPPALASKLHKLAGFVVLALRVSTSGHIDLLSADSSFIIELIFSLVVNHPLCSPHPKNADPAQLVCLTSGLDGGGEIWDLNHPLMMLKLCSSTLNLYAALK